MRRLLYLLLILSIGSTLRAQPNLHSDDWQADLRYLQHTVHKDYSQLFHKITSDDFDAAVEKLYQRIPTLAKHEIVVGLAEIVSLFGYGHTALWLTSWRYNHGVDFHQMPYNLYHFTDGTYVQGVHKDYADALGAKVIRIGATPVADALAAVKPVFSAENDQFFKAHGLHYLGVPEILHAKEVIEDVAAVTLTLEKEGREFTVDFAARKTDQFPGYYGIIQAGEEWLDARQTEPTPLWLKHLDKKYFYEYLGEEKTVYVRQSEIQDDDEQNIPAFYAEVFDFIEANEVEKMVLDVRLNSGGNNYKNKPIITGIIESEKINQPGKFYVVLGRRTFSACQNLVNELENYTEAIFVGEPTGENVNFFGDTRTVTLPNSKLPVRLSYLWWQDKDPRDDRPWTPPHVAVDLSFQDYTSNHDPVMEAILGMSDADPVKEPWSHLVELFNAGDIENLKQAAHVYVKDSKFRYYDFEDRINSAGYDLMGADRFEEARAVFALNAELYPDSANCWDSLAESHWKSGEKDKATEYYNKAISLDPDGPIGENARTMLRQMQFGH